MGRYLTKTVFLVLLLHLFISSSTEEPCYGSKESLETQKFVWFQDRQQLVREMISWVVTVAGIVGSFFYRWHNHQQMLAMIQMHAIRLGVNMNGNA